MNGKGDFNPNPILVILYIEDKGLQLMCFFFPPSTVTLKRESQTRPSTNGELSTGGP
jgi:hypothetical protein